MNNEIKIAVESELCLLKSQVFALNSRGSAGNNKYKEFINKTTKIIDFLIDSPETPARSLAKKFNMQKDEVKLSYKLIQKSPVISDHFRKSYNADYLNIVQHYFNQNMYVIVFFVGLACPSRCIFCPNVTVKKDGTRELINFIGDKNHLLNGTAIKRIFDDIRTMKEAGKKILVKISGGLEPLTDVKTMIDIIENAERIDVPVKLFTNGILLDSYMRREVALRTSDIRISLSTLNEQQYIDILFGPTASNNKLHSFTYLMNNIRSLINERTKNNLKTRIGFNTVVLEENYRDMKGFIKMAESLNLDYLDFKPNYFNPYEKKTEKRIEEFITEIKNNTTSPNKKPLQIYFANSLYSKNVFWKHKTDFCKPCKQGRFKLFITPYGVCTPIHHMAFPYIEEEKYRMTRKFQCGSLATRQSLLDIIEHMPEMPELEYSKLNPFECMLSLEIEREEKDKAWGISQEYNPYDASKSSVLPEDIKENQCLKSL